MGCQYNQFNNCSCLATEDNFIQIPIPANG